MTRDDVLRTLDDARVDLGVLLAPFLGDGADFLVIELGGDLRHLHAVAANAVAESGQLGGGVVRMLASESWVLGRNTGAGRAVAASAGRNLAVSDAATVNALAERDQVFFLGKTGGGFFRGHKISDVFHVLI